MSKGGDKELKRLVDTVWLNPDRSISNERKECEKEAMFQLLESRWKKHEGRTPSLSPSVSLVSTLPLLGGEKSRLKGQSP
jgi:hypothetical protein